MMRIKSRYQVNEKTLLIMLCKEKICQVLELVMSLQEDVRISKFLVLFKNTAEDDLQSLNLSQAVSTSRIGSSKTLGAKSASGISMNLSRPGGKRRTVKRSAPMRWVDKVLEDRALDLEEISVRDFVAIMLDILLYDRGELKNKAFSILVRFFTQRTAMVDLLK